MKKTFVVIYSTIASLIIIFALSFFGFNIYNEYNAGTKNSGNRFERIALGIKQIPDSLDINSAEFKKEVLKSIGNPNEYSSYLRIDINNHEYLVNPGNSSEPESISKLVNYRKRTFNHDDNTITITAYMHIITPAKINFYTKISFAIILFITTITLVLILIENYKTISPKSDASESKDEIETSCEDPVLDNKEEIVFNSDEESVSYYDEEKEIVVSDHEPSLSFDNDVDNEPEAPLPNNFPVVEETEEPKIEIEENHLDNLENQLIQDEKNFEIEEYKRQLENDEEIQLPSEEIKPIQNLNEGTSPSGLFSPLTGFGWESYLKTRLDNELNRATASEIDLSVFVFKLQDIERGSDLCHKVCDYLITEFQFKDMLFEYKDDCLVAVKIGSNVDQSITFANKILLDIDNILKGIGKCFIGISSRSIRMISGERILKEADEALKHAIAEEDSPIIAFRADVEKYRQYLEQN